MRTDEYKNIFKHQQSLWWYQGMTIILRRLLSVYLPIGRKRNILDAGCGTGAAFPLLKSFGTVIGVDVSEEALRFARRVGEKTKKASVDVLPFSTESFDAVVSLDVLYHRWVKNHRKALGEYVRVLKPGGILLWREPAFNWLKSGHDLVDFTERRFTKEQMKKDLKKLPLEIKIISYVNTLLFPLVIIKRLPSIFHVEKPHAKSDIGAIPHWANRIFMNILSLESHLMLHVSLPFGSSVICVAKKL